MIFTWHGHTMGNNCTPRRIDNYSFIYVEAGRGAFRTGDVTYRIEPDDLFILYPDELHEYYTDPADPWNLVWFGLTGDSIARLMQQAGLHKSTPVLKGAANHTIPKAFDDIVCLLDDGSPGSSIFALGHFLMMLGHLGNRLRGRQDVHSGPDERVRRTIRFMELNYAYDIDADMLAGQAGYARTYYSMLFKELTGKTLTEQLIEIRLENARRLLSETGLTIHEVSNSTGYRDPFYFTKSFRKRYGMNPSQYRKIITQK